MSKESARFLWTAAWRAASWGAALTRNQADDAYVAKMLTPEAFEKYWALAQAEGWV